MGLIQLSDKVVLDSDDISSLEEEMGGYYGDSLIGTTLTMKNGRKVLLKGLTLKEVNEKLAKFNVRIIK